MLSSIYQHIEKHYIYPANIDSLGYMKHLHDIEEIIITNSAKFSELKPKLRYYFKMPRCHHPSKISPYQLNKKLSNSSEKLYCEICKLLMGYRISYDFLASIYSNENLQPLSKITLRKRPLLFKCPRCLEDTPYQELRWVLKGLKDGKLYTNFCRRKCYSIGTKYPEICHLWDKSKNNMSLFNIPADDQNLYHEKRYFICSICNEPTGSPMTIYNVVQNSAKCSKHKVRKNTSFAEQAIYLTFKRCLEKFFPLIEVNNKYKFNGNREWDILITLTSNGHHQFCIEYDGMHHFYRKLEDQEKNQYAQSHNITLYRVRSLELKDIKLKDFKNILQRTSQDKIELNRINRDLLTLFKNWLVTKELNRIFLNEIISSIEEELNSLDVMRDEGVIFLQASDSNKNLLKDDPSLATINAQLYEEDKDFITVTEQDVKRSFICKVCGKTWKQSVNIVVKNFKNSNFKSTGCPRCSNKDQYYLNVLKRKAFLLREQGLTQKEISKIVNRSQSTISEWLKRYKKVM